MLLDTYIGNVENGGLHVVYSKLNLTQIQCHTIDTNKGVIFSYAMYFPTTLIITFMSSIFAQTGTSTLMVVVFKEKHFFFQSKVNETRGIFLFIEFLLSL